MKLEGRMDGEEGRIWRRGRKNRWSEEGRKERRKDTETNARKQGRKEE